jgi:ABC-2 type transport system permease protein
MIMASMGKYAGLSGAGGAAGIDELMKLMPKSLQGLLGVGVFDLKIAIDYYAILYIYLALIAGIHAVMLGVGIIAKEERDKTVEFLMTKPVSRTRIVTSKLLSALSMLVLFNVITCISSFIALDYYSKNVSYAVTLTNLMLGMFAIQVFFAALGAFCAGLLKNHKLSFAISTSVLMVMLMISIIVDIIESVSILRYLSVFKYFDAKDIVKGGYLVAYPIIVLACIAVLIYGAYYFYKKRDLMV